MNFKETDETNKKTSLAGGGILRTRASALPVLCMLAFFACMMSARADERTMIGAGGTLLAYNDGNGVIPMWSNLVLPSPGWKKSTDASELSNWQTRLKRDGNRRQWEARLKLPDGQICRYREVLEEDESGVVKMQLFATAEADLPIEGVFFRFTLGCGDFAGGTCTLERPGAPARRAELPRNKPAKDKAHLLYGEITRIRLEAPGQAMQVELAFPRTQRVTLQDDRAWNSPRYTLDFPLHNKTLRKGETTSLTLELRAGVKADRSPVRLTLDAAKVSYPFDGCGGSYCFGLGTPVTNYTLENLHSGWSRSEMLVDAWVPRAEDCPASDTDWAKLAAKYDRPGSQLRLHLEMARELQRRGIPYISSIWRLPEWLYTDPGAHPGQNAAHRIVAPERWEAMLRCLGSYMLYAKEKYGIEPDLFSFNEPDWGVNIFFTPETHRDAIKSIGAHFKKLGLKTRMLLGDVTNPRGTDTYTTPTLADPAALRYVGAVSFHSWGGGTPTQYAAWKRVAEKAGLPLIVAEMGPDAAAHKYFEATKNYAFVLQEIRMYQELLLHARPQAIMQWEFSNDYALLEKKGERYEPTKRFWIDKHFCNLTPPKSEALATKSDREGVLFTAFRGMKDAGKSGGQEKMNENGTVWALHVANLGAARPATLTGLPAGIGEFKVIRTSATEDFKEAGAVKVNGGEVKLELPAQVLLTLVGRE